MLLCTLSSLSNTQLGLGLETLLALHDLGCRTLQI